MKLLGIAFSVLLVVGGLWLLGQTAAGGAIYADVANEAVGLIRGFIGSLTSWADR